MAKLVERLLIQKSRISICGGTRNVGSTLNIDLYVPFANEEHENFIVDFMFQNLWLPCLFIVILSLVMLIRNVGNLLHFNKFCVIRLFETRCTAVVIMSPKSMSFECIWFVRKCMTRYTYFVKKILILCFGQFVSWIISLIFEIFFLIRQ